MITVNDRWELEWKPGLTVRDTLASLGFTHTVVVVSINGLLIPPGDYDGQPLADGDSVKVIHIIGGG
ncbi:MAG TPA: sulfur carrier protein ThiS [Anaerolineae bacterium]|nr:sulfur carrier protein ThiS [Anaerolineae bacterium]